MEMSRGPLPLEVRPGRRRPADGLTERTPIATSSRPMRLLTVGIIALASALCAGLAAPAMADNQQVSVEDNVFVPPGVAVKPGESVTWTHLAGGEEHHNVAFEDGQLIYPVVPSHDPWTTSRTFAAEGIYRYYCQEHGSPGGIGMSGVVYVNATGTIAGVAPTASFAASPAVAAVGQSVTYSAAGSSDADGQIVKYQWDLDGNGSYETDTGAMSSATSSYATAGTRTIKLKVTDSQSLTNETTRTLVVSAPPSASFTASPNPVTTGQTVSFNGSASGDSDGTIAKFEWDLDGDGSYETDTGATFTVTRSYATAGSRTVGLRVTDNAGLSAQTTRSLQVNAPPAQPRPPVTTPVQPILPAPTTAPKTDCSSLSGARRAACVQKTCTPLKGAKRARCIQKSCRYVKGTSRARCVLKSCRYLKGRARSSCKLKSCRSLKGSRKRACVKKYGRRR